jgi:hypothetical protein
MKNETIGKSRSIRNLAKELAKEEKRKFIEWNKLTKEEKKKIIEELDKYFLFIDFKLPKFDNSNKKIPKWKRAYYVAMGKIFEDSLKNISEKFKGKSVGQIYEAIKKIEAVADENTLSVRIGKKYFQFSLDCIETEKKILKRKTLTKRELKILNDWLKRV